MIAPAFAWAERNGILFRLRIVDVQQLVRLLRRQLLIERLENRVVLRRFDKRLAVCFIKTFGACIFLLPAADGLARAADTAGRAGHMTKQEKGYEPRKKSQTRTVKSEKAVPLLKKGMFTKAIYSQPKTSVSKAKRS